MSFFKKLAKKIKKFAKSKVGKILIGAALIYVGGAAMGAWKAPGALGKINGVLAKGGGTVGNATTGTAVTGSTAGGMAPIPSGIETLTVTGKTASSIPSVVGTAGGAGLTLNTAKDAMLPQVQGQSPIEAPTATEAPQGLISKIMNSKAAKFTGEHPYAAAMMLNAGATAMSPDQIDIMREQQDMQMNAEEQDRQRRMANLNISGLNLGTRQITSAPLRYASTGQSVFNSGLINSVRNA